MHTLTVKENILLPLTLDSIPASKMLQRLKDVAQFLGIEELLSKRIYEISGGQNNE